MTPIIGVSRCRKLPDYLEAIRRAGGETRVLDPDEADPERVFESIDGLLLTGGGDLSPTHYGEAPHETLQEAEPGRDRQELQLARLAVAQDRPLLAICRGLQILNVAHGGTLVQDIPSQIPGALTHAVPDPPAAIAHEVWVAPESQLGRILQETLAGTDTLAVNSRHHQALKQIASGFEVAATAPDGVIEALERPGSTFCIGVQWHPENFWRTGEFRPLFEAFLKACEKEVRTDPA